MASIASASTMGNLSSMASVNSAIIRAPKCALRSIFVLDAVSIVCWFVTWFSVGPTFNADLLYVSTGSYGLAFVLACTMPCLAADNKFWGQLNGVCIVHITTVMLYAVAAVLAGASTLDDRGEDSEWHKDDNTGKVDGLAIFAVLMLVFCALGVLLSLFITGGLLCHIRNYSGILPMDIG